jgi:hexosaminidase
MTSRTKQAGLWSDITGGTRGKGLFPDNMMHLGGDEVNTGCYASTPSIAAWLKEKGLTPDQGYEYFVKRAHSIARSQGRDVVGWEEIWNHFGTVLVFLVVFLESKSVPEDAIESRTSWCEANGRA